MPTASDVLARLEGLKAKHAAAARAEAVAATQFESAQRTEREAAEKLKALGIDPEQAAAQIQAELERVDAENTRVTAEIDAAMVSYQTIATDYAKIGAGA
jgi:DNA-binding ferritin-like protein